MVIAIGPKPPENWKKMLIALQKHENSYLK